MSGTNWHTNTLHQLTETYPFFTWLHFPFDWDCVWLLESRSTRKSVEFCSQVAAECLDQPILSCFEGKWRHKIRNFGLWLLFFIGTNRSMVSLHSLRNWDPSGTCVLQLGEWQDTVCSNRNSWGMKPPRWKTIFIFFLCSFYGFTAVRSHCHCHTCNSTRGSTLLIQICKTWRRRVSSGLDRPLGADSSALLLPGHSQVAKWRKQVELTVQCFWESNLMQSFFIRPRVYKVN